MRLEIIIDRKKQVSPDIMAALEQELLKQLGRHFPDIQVRVAGGSNMALNITRASKEEKELLEELVQEVWENAESWMPESNVA
ncbi:DinI-like family protein [Aeromonas bivalvium]|uniref:DinI-like family protein n=1 Tax=Aeromonas bivalvium TaxID=440079 RepID=UPI0005AA0753|nr:DinI-like family protein [Aeromonas bivalvium]